MRCRIGNWKTGMAIQIDKEAFDLFRSQCTPGLKGMGARLLADRRIELFPISAVTGHLGVFGGREEQRHRPKGFHAEAETPLDKSMVPPGTELPLFELHETTVDYDYSLDHLVTAPLGPDHELPWPMRQTRAFRLTAEELRHQCYLRIRSHMLTGGHGYFDEVGVPVEVVHTMAGGYRIALEKARLEVDCLNARAA